MAEKRAAKKRAAKRGAAKRGAAKQSTSKAARAASARGSATKVFTDDERAAMREYVQEKRAAAGRGPRADRAADEEAVLAKIAAMPEPDRTMAQRIHALVTAAVPVLAPRLWYGMPAYARDGQVVCFFQDAKKFKTRYATLGFSDKATLDDGDMWPVAFALKDLTAAEEAKIGALVRKAVG